MHDPVPVSFETGPELTRLLRDHAITGATRESGCGIQAEPLQFLSLFSPPGGPGVHPGVGITVGGDHLISVAVHRMRPQESTR